MHPQMTSFLLLAPVLDQLHVHTCINWALEINKIDTYRLVAECVIEFLLTQKGENQKPHRNIVDIWVSGYKQTTSGEMFSHQSCDITAANPLNNVL
mgnify:CR=1 FL=1